VSSYFSWLAWWLQLQLIRCTSCRNLCWKTRWPVLDWRPQQPKTSCLINAWILGEQWSWMVFLKPKLLWPLWCWLEPWVFLLEALLASSLIQLYCCKNFQPLPEQKIVLHWITVQCHFRIISCVLLCVVLMKGVYSPASVQISYVTSLVVSIMVVAVLPNTSQLGSFDWKSIPWILETRKSELSNVSWLWVIHVCAHVTLFFASVSEMGKVDTALGQNDWTVKIIQNWGDI
jgi:hypothetical protein